MSVMTILTRGECNIKGTPLWGGMTEAISVDNGPITFEEGFVKNTLQAEGRQWFR